MLLVIVIGCTQWVPSDWIELQHLRIRWDEQRSQPVSDHVERVEFDDEVDVGTTA